MYSPNLFAEIKPIWVFPFYPTFSFTLSHGLLVSKLTFWDMMEQKTFLPLTFKDTPSADLFSEHSVSQWSAGTNLSPQFHCIRPTLAIYLLGHRLLAQVARNQPRCGLVWTLSSAHVTHCITYESVIHKHYWHVHHVRSGSAPTAVCSKGPVLANILTITIVLSPYIYVKHIGKLSSIHASSSAKRSHICTPVSRQVFSVSLLFSAFNSGLLFSL